MYLDCSALSKFVPAVNPQNNNIVLIDKDSGAKIDRAIHGQIAAILRKIHHLEQNNRKPANGEAKEYMIHRARQKMKRMKNKKLDSRLEELIVALVNTEQYHYGFEGTRELSIYQFMAFHLNTSIRLTEQPTFYSAMKVLSVSL